MDAAHPSMAGAPRSRLDPARFGFGLFLVTEAMFFAGLLSAALVLREGSSQFGDDGGTLSLRMAVFATLTLLLSSFCISRATIAIRRGREARIIASWTARTVLFGALFLLMQFSEWRQCAALGITPRTNLYWSTFFVLTGVHGLHVLGGLIWLVVAWFGARRGVHALRVELAALYWHFVDLVWLALFTLLYLA